MNARRRRLVTTTSPAGEVACCLPASPCARAACSRSWCNADTPIAVLHSGAALTITVGSAPWKLVMGRHPGKQGCWAAAAQGGHGLAGRQCRAQVQRAPGAMCPLTELRGWPWVCHFSHVKFPPGLGWRASRTEKVCSTGLVGGHVPAPPHPGACARCLLRDRATVGWCWCRRLDVITECPWASTLAAAPRHVAPFPVTAWTSWGLPPRVPTCLPASLPEVPRARPRMPTDHLGAVRHGTS